MCKCGDNNCTGCEKFLIPESRIEKSKKTIDYVFESTNLPFKRNQINNNNELFCTFIWEGYNNYGENEEEVSVILETTEHVNGKIAEILLLDENSNICYFERFNDLTLKNIYKLRKIKGFPLNENMVNLIVLCEDVIKLNLYSLSIRFKKQ